MSKVRPWARPHSELDNDLLRLFGLRHGHRLGRTVSFRDFLPLSRFATQAEKPQVDFLWICNFRRSTHNANELEWPRVDMRARNGLFTAMFISIRFSTKLLSQCVYTHQTICCIAEQYPFFLGRGTRGAPTKEQPHLINLTSWSPRKALRETVLTWAFMNWRAKLSSSTVLPVLYASMNWAQSQKKSCIWF